MEKSALLTITAAANILGMTRQAFSKGVRSGRFTPAQRKESGRLLFDPEVIRQEYESTREMAEAQDHARYLREALKANCGNGAIPKMGVNTKKLLAMKYRKEAAQAKTIELNLKVRRGEYISKKLAIQQGAELGQILMGFFETWPARIAPILAGMRDADEHDILTALKVEVQELIKAILAKFDEMEVKYGPKRPV